MLRSSIESGRRLAPLLAATLLAGCAAGPARQPQVQGSGQPGFDYPQAAVDDFARALGYMDAGDAERARELLLGLSRRHPDYAGPYLNLAILAAGDGDAAAAQDYLQQALAVCQHCAPAWNQLGILHRQAGRFDEAEQAYRAALDSDPGYAYAHYNLGVLYDLYQQRHALAVEQYEQYVALAADERSAEEVGKWIADLRRRLGLTARTAQAGPE